MTQDLRAFIDSVNFKVAVAVKKGIPLLEIVAALEAIAGAIEDKIEAQLGEQKDD